MITTLPNLKAQTAVTSAIKSYIPTFKPSGGGLVDIAQGTTIDLSGLYGYEWQGEAKGMQFYSDAVAALTYLDEVTLTAGKSYLFATALNGGTAAGISGEGSPVQVQASAGWGVVAPYLTMNQHNAHANTDASNFQILSTDGAWPEGDRSGDCTTPDACLTSDGDIWCGCWHARATAPGGRHLGLVCGWDRTTETLWFCQKGWPLGVWSVASLGTVGDITGPLHQIVGSTDGETTPRHGINGFCYGEWDNLPEAVLKAGVLWMSGQWTSEEGQTCEKVIYPPFLSYT